MPTHPAAVIVMIHHPVANFCFALRDGGADFYNDATGLVPPDDRSRNSANT
jgi:hypothetical protein